MVEKSIMAVMVCIAITTVTVFGADILSFLSDITIMLDPSANEDILENLPEGINPASEQEVTELTNLGVSSFIKVAEALK